MFVSFDFGGKEKKKKSLKSKMDLYLLLKPLFIPSLLFKKKNHNHALREGKDASSKF